jgi:hypothetical protein
MFSVISRTDARRNSQSLPPRAVDADTTTDATCLSAQPDAAQGAEQHVDKVFAMARPMVLFPKQDAAE